MPAVITCAPVHKHRLILPRQRRSDCIPIWVEKTAQHHVYAACSEPREDRFQVSYDRIWVCAPEDIIIAALNDRDVNAVRHITVEPSRDISEGVPCDASVPDLSLVPCGPQKGFQARGERLVTSHSESCSVAVADSDYSDPLCGRLARE